MEQYYEIISLAWVDWIEGSLSEFLGFIRLTTCDWPELMTFHHQVILPPFGKQINFVSGVGSWVWDYENDANFLTKIHENNL